MKPSRCLPGQGRQAKAAGVLEPICSNAPIYLRGPELRPSHLMRKSEIVEKNLFSSRSPDLLNPSVRPRHCVSAASGRRRSRAGLRGCSYVLCPPGLLKRSGNLLALDRPSGSYSSSIILPAVHFPGGQHANFLRPMEEKKCENPLFRIPPLKRFS